MIAKKNRPATNEADQDLVKRTLVQVTSRNVCSRCGEEKPLDLFASDRRSPNGHRPTCADCRSDYDSENYYRKRCREYGIDPVIERFLRSEVVERYGDRCSHCVTGAFECREHVVCVAGEGPHTLDNVRPSCQSCNSLKYWLYGEQRIREFRQSSRIVEVAQ